MKAAKRQETLSVDGCEVGSFSRLAQFSCMVGTQFSYGEVDYKSENRCPPDCYFKDSRTGSSIKSNSDKNEAKIAIIHFRRE
jgi:hypothetical protein